MSLKEDLFSHEKKDDISFIGAQGVILNACLARAWAMADFGEADAMKAEPSRA